MDQHDAAHRRAGPTGLNAAATVVRLESLPRAQVVASAMAALRAMYGGALRIDRMHVRTLTRQIAASAHKG